MILLGVNSVVLLLMVITGFITYSSTHHELDELFDAQLTQYARLLDQLLIQNSLSLDHTDPLIVYVPQIAEDGIERTSAEERRPEGHKYENKVAFQVWSTDGKLLMKSANASDRELAPRTSGYHEVFHDNRRWICYSTYNSEHGYWIFTGQREDVRGELSFYLALDQLIPLSIALLPITILIWIAVYWGIKPIRDLSKELATTKPSMLTPIDITLPVELRPFQIAINQLLKDLKSYLVKEKRFIADASHELRTPLSILLVHADNIKKSTSKEETDAAANAILISTKRLSHLVSQLMETEKLEHSGQLKLTSLKLISLIEESLALVDVGLLDKVEWDLDIDPSLELRAEPGLLVAALRNLLDNAAKYAKVQSHVRITAHVVENKLVLTICNELPEGIDVDLERMGERFYRHQSNQHISGAGLGISITTKILELHNAELSYSLESRLVITTVIFSA